MTSDGIRAHLKNDSTGQHLVLTDERTLDDAQATGRWIKTTCTVEVQE